MNLLHLALGCVLLLPVLQDSRPAKEAPADSRGASEAEAAAIREQLPSYPLETCVVSGEKLGEDSKSLLLDGTLVRVCCSNCVKVVKKDAAAHANQVKRGVIAAQGASYPLQTCAVSGEPLGDKPKDHVYGTRLVRTCCGQCVKTFDKEPAKYMAKVDAALIRDQVESYPSKKCAVSGEALGSMGDPINRLYGTKLIRLCCKGCIKSYEKDPAKFAAKVYPSKKAARKPEADKGK